MTRTVTATPMTLAIPGAFYDEWIEGSAVGQVANGIGDAASVGIDPEDATALALIKVLADGTVTRRGRGYTLTLTTDDVEVAWRLVSMADSALDDQDNPAATRAAKKVIANAHAALRPFYEQRYPAGSEVTFEDQACIVSGVYFTEIGANLMLVTPTGGRAFVRDDRLAQTTH